MIYEDFDELLIENIRDLNSLHVIIEELTKEKLNPKNVEHARHLTNYFIIRSCGTIEQCLKMLFYCHFKNGTSNLYVLTYLEHTLITKNSKNPSSSMIANTVKLFDDSRKFNNELKSICKIDLDATYQQLDSLRNLRNQIAHGDRVTPVFSDIPKYFDNCILLLFEIKNTLLNYY